MRACTFLGQAKGIGEMDTRMEAGDRQAACREALSSCPSVASSPGSELAPPVPTMSRKHQQHRHPHDAQRDVGQHAPSPATSPPGRRVHASRKHPAEKTPCSSTPIQSAKLVQAAHQQRVEALQSACPAGRGRRTCGHATRAICWPWPLRRGDPKRPRRHLQAFGWRIPRSNGVLCHWLGSTGGEQQAFRRSDLSRYGDVDGADELM